jgi:hypothetical protein
MRTVIGVVVRAWVDKRNQHEVVMAAIHNPEGESSYHIIADKTSGGPDTVLTLEALEQIAEKAVGKDVTVEIPDGDVSNAG